MMLAARYAADIRRLFEDDDVRRDVTSFCESDACQILVAFAVPSAVGAGVTVRLTASLADAEMHRASKLVCFRKLVATLKAIPVAMAGAVTSSGIPSAATGVASNNNNNSTAVGAVPSTGATSTSASKITHENIHRLVSFFEVKPHMLRSIAHFVSDVVLPVSLATAAAQPSSCLAPLRSSSVTSIDGSAQLSPRLAESFGGLCPPPVKKSIELEMERVSQMALVASGVVEGRTQLPKLPRHDDLLMSPNVSSQHHQGAATGNSSARRQSALVSFDQTVGNASSNTSSLAGNMSMVTFENSTPMLLPAAEQLASLWLQQLHAAAKSESTQGSHEKIQMEKGGAFRFVPINPLDEVQYWRGRVQDLDHICMQLRSAQYFQVLETLEQASSKYHSVLQSAQLVVEEQQQDARIILRWLLPLVPFFEAISLQSQTHLELPALVRERTFVKLFHLMYVMWSSCPSATYPSCARLASLVAGVAELFVVHATHYMSLDMYLVADGVETRRRVKVVFDVATAFKSAFFHFKGMAVAVVHPAHTIEAKGDWRASTQQIFAHLDHFLERLNDILEVLDLRSLFDWLQLQSVSSVEAESIRLTITDVTDKFRRALISFSHEAVDLIDKRDDRFENSMQETLMSTAKQVMERLGSQIVANAESAPFCANLVSRMQLLLKVLVHPLMKVHGYVTSVVKTVCTRWAAEIRAVQTLHVENRYGTFLSPYVPETAKSLVFSLAVFRRLYELQIIVKRFLDEPCVDQECEELQESLLVYNATCQRVGAAVERSFKSWCDSLGDVIARLNAPLLQRQPLSRRFVVALDHHVTDALREVAMIVSVMSQPLARDAFAHLTIPSEATILLQLKEPLWRRFTVLHASVESYYDHAKTIAAHEKGVVDFELGSVESLMKRGLEDLTWEDEHHIDEFNSALAESVSRVAAVLETTRAPLTTVRDVFDAFHADDTCQYLPLRTSRVGDRTMQLHDFVKKYEDVISPKRREVLEQAAQRQRQFAMKLFGDLVVRKQQANAPLVHLASPSFKNIYLQSLASFWTHLNQFASAVLTQYTQQLDPNWLKEHDGLPLLEVRVAVVASSAQQNTTTSAPTSAHSSGSRWQSIATKIGVTGESQGAAGIYDLVKSLTSNQTHVLALVPDIEVDLRALMSRLATDVVKLIYNTVQQLHVVPPETLLHDDTHVLSEEGGHASGVDAQHTAASCSSRMMSSRSRAGTIQGLSPLLNTSDSEDARSSVIRIVAGSGVTPLESPMLPSTPACTTPQQASLTSFPAIAGASLSTITAAVREPPKPLEALSAVPWWEAEILSKIEFSADSAVMQLQRTVDGSVTETVLSAMQLLRPLQAFEVLWSPEAAVQLKELLRCGAQPVFGLAVDDIRDVMLHLKQVAERVHEIPNVPVCHGWLRVDCRSVKHTITTQHAALRTLLLDHMQDRILKTLHDAESYVDDCYHRLDNAGPLLDSKNPVELKQFFAMLRTIRTRYERESCMFLPMTQGLRVLSTSDHLSRQEVTWITERIEALHPRWEALHDRSISVRSQLTSLQDTEMIALRRNAAKLEQRFANQQESLRQSVLFAPVSLETNDLGLLEAPAVWKPFDSTTELLTSQQRRLVDDVVSEDIRDEDLCYEDASLAGVFVAQLEEHSRTQVMYESDDIYELLDEAMLLAQGNVRSVAEFHELQELFEVAPPSRFDAVDDVVADIALLKHFWDTTIHINHQVREWMETPFVEVDPSALVDECRRFSAAYGMMPSHKVRSWKAYTMAEKRLQNLMESLPLIQDLRSNALRSRHWLDLSVAALGYRSGSGGGGATLADDVSGRAALAGVVPAALMSSVVAQQHMQATGTPSVDQVTPARRAPSVEGRSASEVRSPSELLIDPASAVDRTFLSGAGLDPTNNRNITLGTLIRLNLHEHADFVRKLVERAEKELLIERNLERIVSYWKAAHLPFAVAPAVITSAFSVHHDRQQQKTLRPDELALELEKRPPQSTATLILGSVDDFVESVDEHLNILQNILNSRWADVFRRSANAWLEDLSYVDSIFTVWVKVQKALLSLFPIFARSEDLRQTMQRDVDAFDQAATLFFSVCDLLSQQQQHAAESGRTKQLSAVKALCTTFVPVPNNVDEMLAVAAESCELHALQEAAEFHNNVEVPGDSGGHVIEAHGSMVNLIAALRRSKSQQQVLPTKSLGSIVRRGSVTSRPVSGTAVRSSAPTIRVLAALELVEQVISFCEQRLGTFLEFKRRRFPRFYFVSDVDLIDILSKEHDPPAVCTHMHQIMSAVSRVEFHPDRPQSIIVALHSVDGEVLTLPGSGVECLGRPVEAWLDDLLEASKNAVRQAISQANVSYMEQTRAVWMLQHISQAVLVVARSHWTVETTAALEQVENGSLSAMGDHAAHLRSQLSRTIECILNSSITPRQRKALISLITVDVHMRDVVLDLQQKRVDSPVHFAWQSQLRFYFHNDLEEARQRELAANARARRRRSRSISVATGSAAPNPQLALTGDAVIGAGKSPAHLGVSPQTPHHSAPTSARDEALRAPTDFDITLSHAVDRCSIQICDSKSDHGLDYTGNCGCLVITPLTDRCYITLTQAMKLCKGGAPAGPAGTGKTETVKDIAHAMGSAVYVFNCSDQMDVTSVSNIFKGLAMSGVWGCFDEFNRIAVEVLSVVSAQVKCLFDAKRRQASTFRLLGDECELPFLANRLGIFITMNPGYKGRTELPENVKSLFRPCAMVVPDVANIAEIMLCAEGFSESKELARKFVRLYELSAEVLSPEAHYDWGLRAMRAVLLMAGTLKRQQQQNDEKSLLLKALRDANLANSRLVTFTCTSGFWLRCSPKSRQQRAEMWS